MQKDIFKNHGLVSCESEPCMFSGTFKRGSFSGRMAVVLYVDDVSGADQPQAFEKLKLAFREKVANRNMKCQQSKGSWVYDVLR